jgi:hypothetical protein
MTTDCVSSFSGSRASAGWLGVSDPPSGQLGPLQRCVGVYPLPKVCARATRSSVADVTHSRQPCASTADAQAELNDETTE